MAQQNKQHMSNTKNWDATMMIPSDSDYICRVVETSFSPSKSSGNPMITLVSEIVLPDTKEIAGQQVNIAGVKCQPQYYTTKTIEGGEVDEDKTEAAYRRVFYSDHSEKPSLYQLLGFDGSKEDVENPNIKQLVGVYFYAQISAKKVEDRKTPTAAQIEAAKKTGKRPEGDVQKHPVTGKLLVKYWPEIKQIFGVAPKSVGSNKPY